MITGKTLYFTACFWKYVQIHGKFASRVW